MPTTKVIAQPVTKTNTIHIDEREFKVVSIYEGAETVSKLLYDLAAKRILREDEAQSRRRGHL